MSSDLKTAAEMRQLSNQEYLKMLMERIEQQTKKDPANRSYEFKSGEIPFEVEEEMKKLGYQFGKTAQFSDGSYRGRITW